MAQLLHLFKVALFLFIAAGVATTTAFAADTDSTWLDIEVGKSSVLKTPKGATAIAVTDPTVADIITLGHANRIQIQGKTVGSTDLVIQLDADAQPIIYQITVHQNLSELIRRVNAMVEGTPPRIYPLEGHIIAEGNVDDLDTLEHITQLLTVYDENFVNLMSVRGDHQVQLEVVFAEVSRTGLRELGLNALFGGPPLAFGVQSPTASPTAELIHPYLATMMQKGIVGGATSAGFNIMTYIDSVGLATVLSVLDDYSVSKILAKPTLVALSGNQANFQAGGEVPVINAPTTGTIKIEFKPYGVIVAFVPTVLANNVVDVRVELEVSEVDYAGGTSASGIEVPAFITRKSSSHLRIESGMTFAVAGMLSEGTSFTRAQIPLLGDFPFLGTFFRYTRHQRQERELMIFVTPRLVRPMAANEVPHYPGVNEDSNPTDFELFMLGLDHRTGSRKANDDNASSEMSAAPGPIGLMR
jgi:pilus assembly protein CpaC